MPANLENSAMATGLEKGQFSFQSRRKAMPKNAQTTTQLHSSHTEKAMGTQSSTLAWKVPWTEELGRLQSMRVAKSRTWLSDFTVTFCGLSLVAVTGGYSVFAVHRLLVVASLVTEHRLLACELSSFGSVALEHKLSNGGAQAWLLHGMWDLPGSGTELTSPALTCRFFTTEPWAWILCGWLCHCVLRFLPGNSLAVQWLELHALAAEGLGSIQG